MRGLGPLGRTVVYCQDGARPCGVYDHARIIVEPLLTEESGVTFADRRPWSLVLDRSVNTVHVHYPSLGFGWSVWPLPWVLSLRLAGKHLLLTVHEYELAHPLRKLFIRLLALPSDRLFTPSPTLCNRFGAKAHAIPSGSNIPFVPIGSEERERMKAALGLSGRSVLGFFGFRESKGFARFVDAARSLPGGWTALVIGGRSGADSVGDGIVTTGYVASPVKTSHLLQLVDVFYLPYPDGLSERRGSFWAAVEHQVPVISVTGSDTTDRCRGPGIYLYDPSDSPDRWRQLLEQALHGPRPTLPDRLQRDAILEVYRAAYARA